MPKPKKDGEKVSFYLDRVIVDRLREHAAEKGQTLTTVIERALIHYLDIENGTSIAQSELRSAASAPK